jgi:hypothetical protein
MTYIQSSKFRRNNNARLTHFAHIIICIFYILHSYITLNDNIRNITNDIFYVIDILGKMFPSRVDICVECKNFFSYPFFYQINK